MTSWEIIFKEPRDPDPNYRYWVSCADIYAAHAIVVRDYGQVEYMLRAVDSD